VIVVDASAMLELLLRTPRGAQVAARLADPDESLYVPHLLDVEVVQVLRRYEARGVLTADEARAALDDLVALDVERSPHDLLLPRIWELRANLSAYDAAYVALAEALEATLVTCDAKLAGAPRLAIDVELIT
jgi:predicted nucleic acid-binding protein